MQPHHRLLFWLSIAIGIVIISIGWVITLRNVFQTQAPVIAEKVESGVESAREEIGNAGSTAVEDVSAETNTFSEALEALKAGYNAEKQRQQEQEYAEEETN